MDAAVSFVAMRLKPCPFCGAKAEMRIRSFHGDSPTHLVVCTSPGCIEGRQFGHEVGSEQEKSAANWWNSRQDLS